MHNTERDNRALFSLFFFFFYSPPIVEGENVITVFCNAQFPLTIFQLSRDQQQDHAYNFISRNFHVNFFFLILIPWKISQFDSWLNDIFHRIFLNSSRNLVLDKRLGGKNSISTGHWRNRRRRITKREREREEILVFLSWQFHTYPFSTPQQCTSGRFPSFRAFLSQPSKSFSSPPPPPARNVGSLWADGWFPFNVFHRLIFFPPCWFEGVVASSKGASIGVFPPPPRYHPRILRILPLSLSFLHPLPLFFCLSRSLRGGNSRTKGEMFTFAICLNFLFLFFFSRIIIGLEEKL